MTSLTGWAVDMPAVENYLNTVGMPNQIVTATGGSTARTLAAWAARIGDAVMPENHGAVSGTGVSSGVRSANRVAFNNAAAQAASEGRALIIPALNYEIAGGSIDWTDLSGLTVLGRRGDPASVCIKQFEDNIPIIKVGASGATYIGGQRVSGLNLEYNTQQVVSNTSAKAFWIGGSKYAEFNHIEINKAYEGFSQNTTSGALLFSCRFGSLVVRNWTGWALHLENAANGNTGSAIDNFYCINGGSGSEADCIGGIYIQTCSQVALRQVNVEFCKPTTAAMQLLSAQAADLVALNFEGVIAKNSNGLLRIWTTLANVSGMMVNNCTFRTTDTGTFSQGIIMLGDGGEVDVTGLWIKETTRSGLNLSVVSANDQSNGQAETSARVRSVKFGANNAINRFEELKVSSGSARKRFPLVAANDMLAAGGPVFVPTNEAAYTFSWKADVYDPTIFCDAAIAADRTITLSNTCHPSDTIRPPTGARVRVVRGPNCTGSFNILIKDNSAVTLATLASAGTETECRFDGTDYKLLK